MGAASIWDDKIILHKNLIAYYRCDNGKENHLNLLVVNCEGALRECIV